ncbi:MAG: ROK family protein [Proteobacteria bacterium]|nr:ROK family protein [Pseudomonadota bacterium]
MSHRSVRIGIDLGGTKIEGLALADDGTEIRRIRVASPRDDYRATLETIAALVAELEPRDHGTATVGLGIPGSISPSTGRVQGANSTWLNGQPLRPDLEARLDRPVRIANDANCFAVSEATDGAGAGSSSVFGVILGTGVGGGIVIDGRLTDGPHGIGGEWGHNPLPWMTREEHPGPQCWCGRPGCIETWASGPGLASDHARVTGQSFTAEEIAARAAAGDAQARATLTRHADRLARSLAHVVNLLDPATIVLGGGLSKMGTLYAALPPLIGRWVFADKPAVKIVPPKWGDASGVRGAAWLWD